MTKALLTIWMAAAPLMALAQPPLSQGLWHRMGIQRDGIYRISLKKLKEMGYTSPSSVRIYGNGMGMLPASCQDPSPGQLEECKAIEQDGYLYFYAKGPCPQQYSPSLGMYINLQNPYTSQACYFIGSGDSNPAPRMQQQASDIAAQDQASTGIFSYHHEQALANIQNSGQKWLGEKIAPGRKTQIAFSCNTAPLSARVAAAVAARSGLDEQIAIAAGGQEHAVALPASKDGGQYASEGQAAFSINPGSSQKKIEIEASINPNYPQAAAYIDFVSLQTEEKLSYKGKQLIFKNINSTASATRFIVENLGPSHIVMDVSYPQPIAIKPSSGEFTAPTGGQRTFAISAPGDAPEPEFIEEVPNQNLRQVRDIEYLIICPEIFMQQAQAIARLHPDLKCLAATDQQIYNEFSSGMRDPAAIRNFARHLYANGKTLKYMLLLGDGSCDNLHDRPGNPNTLPTYQSENSLNENGEKSFASDDFFAMLESQGECQGPLCIGVGRLPASTGNQAWDAVRKIEAYTSAQDPGDFRMRIVIAADDGDLELHQRQAESIASQAENSFPDFQIKKIYLDSYTQETSAAGSTYPAAREDLIQSFEQGALMINYIGHGGMRFFADERVLITDDIEAMENIRRLPVLIASSCNIGHFDYYDTQTGQTQQSPAEIMVMSPKGGAIAAMAASREAAANSNFLLNQSIMQQAAKPGARLGDIIKDAKNEIQDRNMLNYILLGDPAIKLPVPEHKIEAAKINGISISQFRDTLKAMSEYTIECQAYSAEDFAQGYAYMEITGKPRAMKTLGNGENSPFEFFDQGSTIFKGKSALKDGKASFTFTVPKDISYSPGPARISLYAENGGAMAMGSASIMAGGSGKPSADSQGPQISARAIETGSGAALLIAISDPSGINITGTPGHQITATDTESGKCRNITPLFQPGGADGKSGTISLPAASMGDGILTIEIKAWDNMNNPSQIVARIAPQEGKGLQIYGLRVYPNPCSGSAFLDFAHSAATGQIGYTAEAVSASGKKAWQASGSIDPAEPGIQISFPDFLGSGTYILRLQITDQSQQKAQASARLIYMK